MFVNRSRKWRCRAGMAYVGSDSKLAGKLQILEELAKLMNGKAT